MASFFVPLVVGENGSKKNAPGIRFSIGDIKSASWIHSCLPQKNKYYCKQIADFCHSLEIGSRQIVIYYLKELVNG